MTTYEKLSLISYALSSLATFSVVFIALWQVKYSSKKKLKLQAATISQMQAPQNSLNSHKLVEVVYITNIGNREVVLTEYGIKVSNEISIQCQNSTLDPQNSFPLTVGIEQRVQIDFVHSELYHCLFANRKEFRNLNQKLVFYVTDTSGKKYYVKSQKPISRYLMVVHN